MIPNDERTKRPESLRNYRKFPALRDYFERVTTATRECIDWYQHDDWKKRFGPKIRLLGSEENRPFLDMTREHMPEFSEVPMFILPDPRSRRWERIASHIEWFCGGASFVLDRSVPGDAEKPTFEDVQEPRAWVSDRNCAPEGLPPPQRVYGRVLDCIELYAVLQKKRFRDDACDDTVGHRRHIYINNPNGSSILALIRTAPLSQVEGFRELFAHYITESPAPKIGLKSWLNGCFVISFNLPFFAIRTQDQEDVRTIFNEKRPFRYRRSLSFLNSNRQRSGNSGSEGSASRHQAFLHEAVCSLMVTGKSERYWTAVFLDEDFYVDQPRLSVEEEEDVLVGSIDPIIIKAEMRAAATPASPRAYALASLAATLRGIVEHHADIQDEFEASLYRHTSNTRHDPPDNISNEDIQEWRKDFQDTLGRVMYGNLRLFRKVDEFLTQDVLISPDGLPHSPQWSGLQEEPDAVNSLRRIIESRNSLRDIQNEFLQFIEEAKRERKNYHVDEQQTFSRQLQQFTVAALVLGILNLVAQLYSGRPERGDSSAWTGFLIIVVLSVTIGGCTLVILFWAIVSSSFATLSRWLPRLPSYLRRVPQTARDFGFTGGLGGFINFLQHYLGLSWDYVGIARLFRLVRRLFRR